MGYGEIAVRIPPGKARNVSSFVRKDYVNRHPLPLSKIEHRITCNGMRKGRYTNTSDTAEMYNMDVTITPCKDGSYCCGNGTFAQPCCDQKEGVFMVNGDAIPYTSVSPTLTSLTTPPSLITPLSSITTRLLTTSPPVTSSSPGPSAESASLAPSSRVIAAIVCGTCALLLLVGALAFTLRKFRPVQPLKSQISKPRILKLPPEVHGDDGSNELDGFREFELDRPGNYPEML